MASASFSCGLLSDGRQNITLHVMMPLGRWVLQLRRSAKAFRDMLSRIQWHRRYYMGDATEASLRFPGSSFEPVQLEHSCGGVLLNKQRSAVRIRCLSSAVRTLFHLLSIYTLVCCLASATIPSLTGFDFISVLHIFRVMRHQEFDVGTGLVAFI
jgi:hypothetical protein